MDKWLYNRSCGENSLSRDEIYQIFVSRGVYFPGKRADDLFFRSNSDGDTTISCEEFVDIYMKEFEEAE
jgi:Ca2+-binding EF-hand superfamily protein